MPKNKPMTAAERQRRCREKRKNDPEKVAEVKRKDLERYHSRKKLVKDMSQREHRNMKRKWNQANERRRERKKMLVNILNDTPAPSPTMESYEMRLFRATPTPSDTSSSRGRKKVRKDRSKLYRTNLKLQEQIDKLEKKVRKYKKRLQRKNKKDTDNKDQQTEKKYATLTNAIKERYQVIKTRKQKRLIQSVFETHAFKQSRKQLEIVKDSLGIERPLKHRTVLPKKSSNLVKKINDFFLRDDVTRATAGKKESVTRNKTKVQKRFLLDTMKNLYQTFLRENIGLKCHYSYFAKHRPFFVKTPTVDARDTCMCKLHANMSYIVFSLQKHKVITQKDTNSVLEAVVCRTDSLSCMKGLCFNCKQKSLVYDRTDKEKTVELRQWVRKSEEVERHGKKIKTTKNVPVVENITIEELITKFDSQLQTFKTHVYNIKHQYKAYRRCIDTLTDTAVALHIDFSENYSGKFHCEVQSHHFGGSRDQVTLHTAVMYQRPSESGTKQITSFCTVSSNLNHGPAAIWAHLHPILYEVQTNLPHVTTIHFFSDGPATQYKQKLNFFLMSHRLFDVYGFHKFTWNFFEAGHGKGAADGVGGTLKRQADDIVAKGKDIPNASHFFHTLQGLSKIRLFIVTDEDVENVAKTIPGNVVPLKGTMQVHQIFSDISGTLYHRVLSCFCKEFCSCHKPKIYRPLPESQSINRSNEIDNNCDLTSNTLREENVDFEDLHGPLSDITNVMNQPRKRIYDDVYSPGESSDEDDQPLLTLKMNDPKKFATAPSNSYDTLKLEDIHPSKIEPGVHTLVKVRSEKNVEYTYVGVARSNLDEEGYVQVMFMQNVNDDGRLFKMVESKVFDVTFDDLIRIIPSPKVLNKGRRQVFQFDEPLEVFEK